MQKEYSEQQLEMFRVFDAVYDISQQNMQEAGGPVEPLDRRVSFFMDTCTPGVLDLRDTMEADNLEFLQMAYYGLFGSLPDEALLAQWSERADEDAWTFRREVLTRLLQSPELAFKEITVRNNIYMTEARAGGRQPLKQRILFAGYMVSRKLPNSIKIPLKKLAMKILMRG